MISDVKLEQLVLEHVVQPFHLGTKDHLVKIKQDGLVKYLERKNPYLLLSVDNPRAEALIESLVSASMAASAEGRLGNHLERLAIAICSEVFDGLKPKEGLNPGIDLEFTRDGILTVVSIKSGPHWGNSSSIRKLRENFKEARLYYRKSGHPSQIRCVNGCCYGAPEAKPLKKHPTDQELNYEKLVGKPFWELISGDEQMHVRILPFLVSGRDRRATEVAALRSEVEENLTTELLDKFGSGGKLDWARLTEAMSG